MSLADVLLLPLYLLALLVPAVGFVLSRAALQPPRINALTFTAGFVDAVGILIVAYVLAVGNATLAYPVPREAAQIVLRGVILTLGLLSVYFFRLYRTGRFRDGEQ
jgi:hypothetical protein